MNALQQKKKTRDWRRCLDAHFRKREILRSIRGERKMSDRNWNIGYKVSLCYACVPDVKFLGFKMQLFYKKYSWLPSIFSHFFLSLLLKICVWKKKYCTYLKFSTWVLMNRRIFVPPLVLQFMIRNLISKTQTHGSKISKKKKNKFRICL